MLSGNLPDAAGPIDGLTEFVSRESSAGPSDFFGSNQEGVVRKSDLALLCRHNREYPELLDIATEENARIARAFHIDTIHSTMNRVGGNSGKHRQV